MALLKFRKVDFEDFKNNPENYEDPNIRYIISTPEEGITIGPDFFQGIMEIINGRILSNEMYYKNGTDVFNAEGSNFGYVELDRYGFDRIIFEINKLNGMNVNSKNTLEETKYAVPSGQPELKGEIIGSEEKIILQSTGYGMPGYTYMSVFLMSKVEMSMFK